MSRGDRSRFAVLLLFILAAGLYMQYGPHTWPDGTRQSTEPDQGWLRSVEPQLLPDLSFLDGKGREVRLSDFRGKFLLLNIWATWCTPCIKEMPALDRLQAGRGARDFEVIALSIDREGLPAVEAFFRKTGIRHLQVYVDPGNNTSAIFAVSAIPTTLLIDRAGRELARTSGSRNWDDPRMIDFLERYLEQGQTRPRQSQSTEGRP
jgi:thiol-disulfide isomerase/thioredoxin